MSASPSYLYVVEGGCPARAADYRARNERVPTDPMRDGSMFHRIVERIGQGMGVEEALDAHGASARVAEMVRRWAAVWTDAPCLGRELAIAVDESGAVVEWGAAWLRGIVDLIEAGDEDGEIVVTDWKSGWSGWTGIQAECYAILGAAWALAQGLRVERVTCRIWSPAAGGFRGVGEWSVDSLPWETVREHVAAALRLEALPADEERPGGGCARCARSAVCETFRRFEVAPAVSVEEEARVYLALLARVAVAEARLRAHCEETGETVGGVGFAPSESRTMNADAVLGALLEPWDVAEDARRALAGVVSVSRTVAEKVARKKRPRDRVGQDGLVEAWTTRVEIEPRWSVNVGGES